MVENALEAQELSPVVYTNVLGSARAGLVHVNHLLQHRLELHHSCACPSVWKKKRARRLLVPPAIVAKNANSDNPGNDLDCRCEHPQAHSSNKEKRFGFKRLHEGG
jgi:hypothetical protein